VTTDRRWPSWAPLTLVGLLILARLISIVAVLHSGVEDENSILGGDARRYEVILSGEGTPYRDFEVEYPPLGLGLMKLVDRPTPLGTVTAVALSQLALELATAGLLAWAWSHRSAITYLLLGTPMVFFPFPYLRIDLLSVFLAVLGLALLRRRWPRTGGVMLALSVFAKIWPVVVAPSMLLRRQWRGLTAWVVTGAAALTAWVAWSGPSGISQILTFRGADGWQIESIPGIVLHALDPHGSTVEQGAWRTAVEAPAVARTGISLIGLAVVVLAWWWAHRAIQPGPEPDDDIRAGLSRHDLVLDGLAPLAAVVSLLVFSSIISPQYVLWFLPFAALVTARGDGLIGGLSLGTVALSTLGLGWIHGLIPGEWHAIAVIALRNLFLVALLTVTLHRLWRAVSAPVSSPDAKGAARASPSS